MDKWVPIDALTSTEAVVTEWMGNCSPLFYTDVITYPCLIPIPESYSVLLTRSHDFHNVCRIFCC